MSGWYDASAGASEPERQTSLADLTGRQATWNLEAALERVGELSAASEEDALPDELVPVLEELTSAPTAPLVFRSLARRVREGHTSWAAWWHDPTAEAGGMDLFQAAFREQLRLARQEAAAPTPTDEESDPR